MHFPGRETGPVPGCSCPKYSTYLLREYRQRLQGQGAGRYGEFIAPCVLGTLSGKAEQGVWQQFSSASSPPWQPITPATGFASPVGSFPQGSVNPCENRRSMDVLKLPSGCSCHHSHLTCASSRHKTPSPSSLDPYTQL